MIKSFVHYSDAAQRKACTLLTERFGDTGYAFWFRTLEYLNQHDAEPIDLSNDNTLFLYSLYAHPMQKDSTTRQEEVLSMLDFCAQYKDEFGEGLIDSELWATKQVWNKNNYNNVSKILKRRKQAETIEPDDPMLEVAQVMWKDICKVYPAYSKKPKRDQDRTMNSWVPILHLTVRQYAISVNEMLNIWKWMHESPDEQAQFWKGVVHSAKSWNRNFPKIQSKYVRRSGTKQTKSIFEI